MNTRQRLHDNLNTLDQQNKNQASSTTSSDIPLAYGTEDWGSENAGALDAHNENAPIDWGSENDYRLPKWLQWLLAIITILAGLSQVIDTFFADLMKSFL